MVPPRHSAAHDHPVRLLVKRFFPLLREAGFLLPATLTAGLWLKGLHPWLPGFSCPLRALTGVPCPTCYLTRATSAALIGQWPAALSLHAFGPLAATVLVGWSIAAIRERRLMPWKLPAWPLGTTSVALLGYWLVRMVATFGLGMHTFPAFPRA
jgi:hypothetical protein